jgi:8-oxo-dGTP pyrophosphatase MutT (NUDIX family)
MEYFDVLDENGKKTGKILERNSYLSDHEYGAAAGIIVRVGQKFLITQRDAKKSGGLKWEFSGGGIQAGEENIDAAKRELEEETGIAVSKDDFTYLGQVLVLKHHLIMVTYEVNVDIHIEDIRLQKGETIDAKIVSLEELKELYEEMTVIDQLLIQEFIDK